MSDPGVRIGEAAALYDLPVSTLRWWEREDVLTPPERIGGQRYYRERDLRRIGLAYLCGVTGMMPLKSAAIVTSGGADLDEWQATVREELGVLDQRIERMTAARDYLRHLLRCVDDDVTECRYLDAELREHTPRGRHHDPELVAAARAASAATASSSDTAVMKELEKSPLRDENARSEIPPGCAICDRTMPPPGRGRPRRYCSRACQQRAYRRRH